MAYPKLAEKLEPVFDASPREVKHQKVAPSQVGVKSVLTMLQEKQVRDMKILCTSSDNMHHI